MSLAPFAPFAPFALDHAGTPAIYVVAKEQNSAAQNNLPNKLGVCNEYRANDSHPVRPIFDAEDYFLKYNKGPTVVAKVNNNLKIRTETQIEVAKQPSHGRLDLFKPEAEGRDTDKYGYLYTPDKDYVGLDNFEFLISVDGKSLRIYYQVKMFPEDENPNYVGYCNWENPTWKISQNSSTPEATSGQLVAWQDAVDISSLLAAASQSLTGFAVLSGNVVGITSGEGSSAQITLDTDASGHGWYIDYTPYLNDEYLPTSNPLEWIAKPGSEAEGKMDLLTVLLHEYGHALGLDHTTDSHDFMATTLQPGVRRLPSAEELDLMAQLLGVAKETSTASPVPYDPFSPPGTPLPTTISLAAFIAARQRRSTLSSALTQFEVAANPTLTNPQFADSQGWSSGGDVAIAAGAATLKETATTQTRLNQAFVPGPNDRFLPFTLSGIALDDVSNAPDDAFEVALIDANTGLSLLGGTGLSHNDAFLNLQADGTEYKASGKN